MSSTTFSGPVTSTAGFISGSDSLVTASAATLTVTAASHAGRTVLLSRAAGVTATLPAATGTGNTYTFFVNTAVTSNDDIIQVADATDVMTGRAYMLQDGGDTIVAFETAADSDTITMDGSTKGGLKGNVVVCQDVATNTWAVTCHLSGTGTEATPFSAAV
ncbi:MAG: hypothetical protein VW518_07540 [Burkholderiaceae bacterium]